MPTDDQLQTTITLFLLAPFLAAAGSVFGGVVTWLALRRAAGQDVSFLSAYLTHIFVNALFLVIAAPLDLMVQLGNTPPEGALMVRLVVAVLYNLVMAVALCRRYALDFPRALRVVIDLEVLAIRVGGVVLGLLAVSALGGLASTP